jgi:peptide/nickel transport system substrate-binding protein
MEEKLPNPRITRRRLIQAGVGTFSALAVPALISACGGSSSSGSSTTAGSTTTAATQKKGGTIKYAAGDAQSKDSLDPALALTSIGTFGLGMIYDSLLAVDVNWNLTPMLAVDHTISTDAKRHTFKLRQGVEFHSGKPFTSADVAAHFKRVLNPKTGSAGLSILQPVLDPSGISAPDPTTIIFNLKTPDAFFGQRVTHYTLRIPESGTTNWLSGSPGTGPFKNVSFKPGEGFEFVRNDRYWQSGLPYLDGVTCAAIPDQATKVQALLSGDAHLSDTIPSSAFAQLQSSTTAELFDLQSPSPFTFDVNGSIKPFSDVRVQHAMKMLLDREKMLSVMLAGHGVVSADSLISPHDPYYPADLKPFPYDVSGAKSLLSQAGYPNGFSEAIWSTSAYPYLDDGAQFGKQYFGAGGIKINIQSVSNDRYLAAYLKQPIVMDYALRQHPVFMFELYYASTSASNISRLKDPTIDKWIGQLVRTLDSTQQKQIAGEIITRYNNMSAELVPFHFSSLWGASRKLQGLRTDPIASIDLRRASLST